MENRLKEILNFWNWEPINFAEYLGKSRSMVYEVLKGKKDLTRESITLIAQKEHQGCKININWLLTGEGEMLRQEQGQLEEDVDKAHALLTVLRDYLTTDEEAIAVLEKEQEQIKQVKADKTAIEQLKKENQTLQERLARLESLEQTKLQRENCVLQGKVGELEKRLEALENLAASYLQKDKMA